MVHTDGNDEIWQTHTRAFEGSTSRGKASCGISDAIGFTDPGPRLNVFRHLAYQALLKLGRERPGAIYLELGCACS